MAIRFTIVNIKNKTAAVSSTTKTSTAPKTTSTVSTPLQKYITISAWGIRVPYSASDTFSISGQTCAENGDTSGDTINIGCQVNVTSQDLANSVGNCQSNKATGTVGYFYRMGANDNYNETSGAGYEPVSKWAAANPGQYTLIGNYYYAFAEIGAAVGWSRCCLNQYFY